MEELIGHENMSRKVDNDDEMLRVAIAGLVRVDVGVEGRCGTSLASLAEGATIREVLDDFPTLTEDDVRAVIAFAAAAAEKDLPLRTGT